MTTESSFILLFTIATSVAIAVRRLRVPYPVALVVVALILGSLRLVEAPHLTKDLLFALFLPGLLFEAAFNIDAKEFWRSRLAVSALAVPGVVVAIGLTGLLVTPVIRTLVLEQTFELKYGLVFGALVAATDPIAVVGLFKSLNAPLRLTTLLDGESLLNDGTSIILLTLLLAYIGGATTGFVPLVVQFVIIVGGGALVGGAVGFVASRVTKEVDDAMIEIALTTIAAYGSFVIGEQLHFSGVIATVSAGLVCANYGREIGMSASTRVALDTFWDYVAFALNSVVFLLIGFEVHFEELASSWREILVAYAAVVIARAGVIGLASIFLSRTGERIPMSWRAVLTWGGMRGALSMVLALGLPLTFPHRTLLVTMTYGVVVVSLLVQGLTMPSLLRRLGLGRAPDARLDYDIARAQVSVSDAGLAEVDRMLAAHSAAPPVLDALRERYERRKVEWHGRLDAVQIQQLDLAREEAERVVRHLLDAEKDHLTVRLDEGLLSRDAYEKLIAGVNERLDRLEDGHYEDALDLVAPREEPDAPTARGESPGGVPAPPTPVRESEA
ncbi:MAG TPA: Na+/H+ antiporter [Gemmatimonadaceae bacterium]|jgi:CPA1 family monovalent cation:H+ antiporter